ncbi:MAG TPA: hypothetical protein VFI01_03610 [Gaiellaceae bacterium]|nr:hypothetical protein [Gaiellaceae bacterium]
MSLSPDVALVYILTTGVGVAMMIGGLRTRALVRRTTRRCPSCGRLLRSRTGCRCSAR